MTFMDGYLVNAQDGWSGENDVMKMFLVGVGAD